MGRKYQGNPALTYLSQQRGRLSAADKARITCDFLGISDNNDQRLAVHPTQKGSIQPQLIAS